MTEATRALGLVLKNDTYELARFSEAVEDFAERNDFSEKDTYEIQLCLEEVFMNVVNYGFDDLDEHDIQVDLQLGDDNRTLVVRVVDDGRPFDPLAGAQDSDLDTLLEDHAMGGIGYRLVHKYVDDISYQHQDGRNHLILTKKVAAQEAAD